MAQTLQSVSSLFRSLVSLIVLGFVGVAGWFGYQTVNSKGLMEAELRQQAAEVLRLSAELTEKNVKIDQLDLAVRLYKQDHRLAKIVVLDQWVTKDSKRPMTKIEFQEIDDDEKPIDQARIYTVEGDMLHVEGLVVKYLDKFVEVGDPVRGASAFFLKRLYGDYQEPSEGFPIDAKGARPAAYARGEQMSDRERDIWQNFWDFANDPQKANEAGIRAAHGQAPFTKMRPGKTYILQARPSGDISIVPEEEFKKHRDAL